MLSMLAQPARFLMTGLFPCLLLGNVLLPSLSASPGGTQGPAISTRARQQIKITASVRPTLALRQQIMASDGNRAIGVRLNMPTMNYDLKVEAIRAVAISIPHSLKEGVDFECSTHNSGANLLTELETSDGNVQLPSVVTLIIAAH
jgi:hypothetical protein